MLKSKSLHDLPFYRAVDSDFSANLVILLLSCIVNSTVFFVAICQYIFCSSTIAANSLNHQNQAFFAAKVLPSVYPFEINTLPRYVLCYLWETYAVLYTAICFAGTDTHFIQSTAIISGLLQVIMVKNLV